MRAALEHNPDAETTPHPGYASGDREGKTASGSTNSRNGSYPKTLATGVGPVTIQVPRDREGSFTPGPVPKRPRRPGGPDVMVIGPYAGGMTVRDIQHHLAKTVGTESSHETVSSVAGAVAGSVPEWRERPSDGFYPVMCPDAIRVKVGDGGRVVPEAAHIAIGVGMGGVQARAGRPDTGFGGILVPGARVRRDGRQGRHGRAGRVPRRAGGPARGRRVHMAAGDGAGLRGVSHPRGEPVRGRP